MAIQNILEAYGSDLVGAHVQVGGGGHVIQNASGTDIPQESAMQFADSHVSDDSTNGRTVVENVKSVASADYSSETEDGMYLIPDGEGAVIEPASDDKVEVTADGVKTYAQLLTELKELIDKTKLQYYSEIVLDKQTSVEIHDIVYWDANVVATACVFTTYGGVTETDTFYIGNNVKYQKNIVGNVTDMSSEKPSNGTKITLYYGNKKATVDLQTTANRCWMSDGVTNVESAINSISYKKAGFDGTTSADGELVLTGFEYSSGYRILLVEDCTLPNATYNIAHGSNPNYIVFKSTIGQSVANQNVTVVFWYKQV